VQKLEVRGNAVYGVTGASSLHKPLIDWVHEHNADPDKKPNVHEDLQDTCVIVWKEGRCLSYDLKSPYPVEAFAPDAWGCGTAAHHAIGAMDSGIDAKTAVERAIIRTTCVGGPVQVIDLESCEALGHDVHGAHNPHDRGYEATCSRCGVTKELTI
jgi:hypothetical protein